LCGAPDFREVAEVTELRLYTRVAATATLLALTLPSCGDGGSCGDGPGIDNTVASAERWVRVLSSPEAVDAEGTVDVDFEVAPVEGGLLEGSPEGETIAVHSSFLPGIEPGLSGQDHVYLALASKGLEREVVIYVVVRGADGNHRFPGDCMSDGEELLRQRLGDKYDERLDSLIGSTDRDRILRLLGASP
jgi:hypothetical protein